MLTKREDDTSPGIYASYRDSVPDATAPEATPADGPDTPAAVEDLDLTPRGLADAPALQQDPDSLVHTGNS